VSDDERVLACGETVVVVVALIARCHRVPVLAFPIGGTYLDRAVRCVVKTGVVVEDIVAASELFGERHVGGTGHPDHKRFRMRVRRVGETGHPAVKVALDTGETVVPVRRQRE
jgi:hypothetical protein